ncbi:MAG: hypothetical protein AVDCRST_MAG18-4049, partial [uncultured Thermomicrobiales bacterium]
PALGAAPPRHRHELVGGQNQPHPRRHPALPGPSALHPDLNRV